MAYTIDFYTPADEEQWDKFILNRSMNGTFLQTRKFINYHPEGRFIDRSLCIRKGTELVGVVLACEIMDEGKRTFFAHKGTTFGGISICRNVYTASAINEILENLLTFIKENGFEKIYFKMVAGIYQKEDTSLLDYFLYKFGFTAYNELNYYLPLERYREDVAVPFTSSKRRDYRYSLKSGFTFKKLETRGEIAQYYGVLLKNLEKLGLHAVHSLEDLYDLKFNRFDERIEFYGVYLEEKMVAGSMLFYFSDRVIHTQYLSSDEEYLKLFPMDFLIFNLIQTAVDKNMDIFSFGICTEDQGRYLNLGLSRFKEGFGTEFCVNRSYEKLLTAED